MNRIRLWVLAGVFCFLTAGSVAGMAGAIFGAEKLYDVRDYGAEGDGKTLCTESIQKAIDECSKGGGGTVYLGSGTFVSGTLIVKSGVTLRLAAGCTLSGSEDLNDYPPKVQEFRSYTDNYTDKSLIYAEKAERIAITGRGVIDGHGHAFKGPYKVRPYIIRFIECRDVTVKDITIRNSPMWVQHYLACDDVHVSGVTVRSRVNGNNDGINIDCCSNVRISDCDIWSGDDAIVLKSTAARPCRNVVVSNCVLSSICNGLKMGTESNGGFENIAISNCAVYDTKLAGLALEMVDGGTMDRVVVSNVTMSGVGAPIFVRLGNRARPFTKDMEKPGVGAMKNITISNIEAKGASATGCAISGLPEKRIENLTLSNIRLSFDGGGTKAEAGRVVPEKPEAYPEYSMFGSLPGYGFFCRHVNGLKLSNVQVQLERNDGRHALVLDHVEDAVIDGFDAPVCRGGSSTIRLSDVKDVFIRGCRPKAGTEVFLQVQGAKSEGIALVGNDFSGAEKVLVSRQDVAKTAVSQMGNAP